MNKNLVFVCWSVLLIALVPLSVLTGCEKSENVVEQVAKVGSAAPDFELIGQDGHSYRLSSLRGKVVLVNFWATWCPPCRAEMPSMDELYRNYSKGPFEMLAINVEENGPEAVAAFSRENQHTFPVLFDQDATVQRLYGVYKFPETFIINKDGIIVEKVVGAIGWTEPDVLSYLNKLIRE